MTPSYADIISGIPFCKTHSFDCVVAPLPDLKLSIYRWLPVFFPFRQWLPVLRVEGVHIKY